MYFLHIRQLISFCPLFFHILSSLGFLVRTDTDDWEDADAGSQSPCIE
jgi:hypothetical protein